jgi:hypothetical protein
LCSRPRSGGRWTGDDWDNWRERLFQPLAAAVGLPKDTRPRDLRGTYASLLIYEGVDVVELAPELGHSPATCLEYYARVFKEFKGLPWCPAVEVIREARRRWRPARYRLGTLAKTTAASFQCVGGRQ